MTRSLESLRPTAASAGTNTACALAPAPLSAPAAADPAFAIEPPEPPAGFSLRDYWRVAHARRRLILALAAAACALAGALNYVQVPVYRSTVTLQIDREQPHTSRLEDSLAQPLEQPDYIETQYKILKSRTLATAVMEKLDLAPRLEYRRSWLSSQADPPRRGAHIHPSVVRRFLEAVAVTPGKGTRLVDVSVDSVDAALSARAANTLAEIYIEQNLAAKWDATQKASGWLTAQLAELKAKLERSEADLLSYAARHSILFVEDKKNITTARLEHLEAEMTRAEAARIERQSAYLLAQDAIARGGPHPGNLHTDTFRDLNLKLTEARREQSQLLVTFGPAYPKVERVRRQIGGLEADLETEKNRVLAAVRDDYLASVEREKLLKETVDRQTRSVTVLGDDIIQYNILKRDAESNRQLYEGLLGRLKEAGVSAGLRASNIRVLDPAEVPEKPHRPKKLFNLALGAVIGLAAGVALAFLSEHLSTVVRTPEEVERATGLALLALVPRTRSALGGEPGPRGRIASSGLAPSSPAWRPGEELAEAYRTLRSSVLLGWDPSMRRLLVTSPQPQDGKTTISLHLAWSLAQLGAGAAHRRRHAQAQLRPAAGRQRRHRVERLPGRPRRAGRHPAPHPGREPVDRARRAAPRPGLGPAVLPAAGGPFGRRRRRLRPRGDRLPALARPLRRPHHRPPGRERDPGGQRPHRARLPQAHQAGLRRCRGPFPRLRHEPGQPGQPGLRVLSRLWILLLS